MDKDKNGKVSSAVLNIPLVGPYQCVVLNISQYCVVLNISQYCVVLNSSQYCVVLNISQYCVVLNSSQYRQVDKEEFTQWLRSIHL